MRCSLFKLPDPFSLPRETSIVNVQRAFTETMAPLYEPTFFLLKRRLPPSESAHLLGRIIRRYQDPTLDFTPDCPSDALTPAIFNKFLLEPQDDNSASFTAQSATNRNLYLKFISLLSTASTSSSATTVTSPRITTRRLKLEQAYFNTLKSIPEVRRQILEMCPIGDKVYLVVGTMSVATATFTSATSTSKTNTVGVSVPLGLMASAATTASVGLPLPPGVAEMMPNFDMGVAKGDLKGGESRYETHEQREEVFAVACKAVTRTWQGLGGDVRVAARNPEYRGGQHLGEDTDEGEDEDEGEDDGVDEEMLARALTLVDHNAMNMKSGVDSGWISNPYLPQGEP
ncbi:hypothetical protein B0T21DRAFT_366815 [Apiosordaria backusii]|uniref:Uncharacterized protein n=1 Tax=Apiosordaria backusii TaxID=314023 RepID=A0AA40BLH5_9PEZI|nr:hypothetical protein B0T21DRAFT_366815 [Apiosordaria backusii]